MSLLHVRMKKNVNNHTPFLNNKQHNKTL